MRRQHDRELQALRDKMADEQVCPTGFFCHAYVSLVSPSVCELTDKTADEQLGFAMSGAAVMSVFCLCVHQATDLFACLPVCRFVCLSVGLSVCLPVCLAACLRARLPSQS